MKGGWLRSRRQNPAAMVELVCFPHAGGSASYFHHFNEHLSSTIAVTAVQYPGRQDRLNEAGLVSIVDAAETIADELDAVRRPLALFGHSMGALIAFETAHLLRDRGRPPLALIVSGSRPPHLVEDRKIHQLSDEDLINEIRSLAGTSDVLLSDDEFVQLLLPTIRADYKATETYVHQPRPALDIPIQVHVGDRDDNVSPTEADEWRRYTVGDFRVNVHEGGHFYLNDCLDVLGKSVSALLEPSASSP